MKIVQMIMFAGLALGLSQTVSADQHSADGKHCDYKKHSMQEADTNKDGAISHDEFTAAHQARAEKMFAKMDANGDGKIDASERQAMKAKMKDRCKMNRPKIDDKEAGPK